MRDGAIRIAMWSGPRNISTAMMRAWDARSDTVVCDEPLYAHYLMTTGKPHPGAEAVIEHHETDLDSVVKWLTGPVPGGALVFYQKHMTHHVLPSMPLDWLDGLVNCFLIRSPAEVILSFSKVVAHVELEDTGIPQQARLFEHICSSTGAIPPVIDARDVLCDPARVLRGLCNRVGVDYTDAMLQWAPGIRPTDGVWAKHWYGAVERSTGFGPYQPRDEALSDDLQGVVEQAQPLYAMLHEHRIV
jgi:hypothetical protein